MNLVIGIPLTIFVIALVFSRDLRHWMAQTFNAIWALIAMYAPRVARFLRTVLTAYAVAVLIAAVLIFILISVSLMIGWPVLTGICFILAIILLLIVILPVGIIRAITLKLFGRNVSVVPMSVRVVVSYVALFGFLGLIHPEIMSLNFVLGITLVGFFSIGLKKRFSFLEYVAWPVVAGMCLLIVMNYCWPRTFRATDRWLVSLGNVWNAHRDRNTVNNNTVAMVTYGKLKEDLNVVYDATLDHDSINQLKEIPMDLKQGTVVKLVNQSSDVMKYDGQGFIRIQLANKNNGHFPGGRKVWVEADLITIGTRDEIVSNSSANNSTVASPGINSETFTLHKGEQWFPTHQFHRGDKLTLTVRFNPVTHIQGNGSTETIGVGSREMTMCSDGSPAFEGQNGLSEVTVRFHS